MLLVGNKFCLIRKGSGNESTYNDEETEPEVKINSLRVGIR